MNRSRWIAGLAPALALWLCVVTEASPGVGFHVAPASGRYGSGCADSIPACGEFATAGPLMPQEVYVYVIALEGAGAGISALEFGISYEEAAQSGLDVFQWFGCAAQEIPTRDWPAPGSGNTIFWQRGYDCLPGSQATAGYFHCGAYSADVLRFAPHPASEALRVVDCAGTAAVLDPDGPFAPVGTAMFSVEGTEAGLDPCSGTGLVMQAKRRQTSTPRVEAEETLTLNLSLPANPSRLSRGPVALQLTLPQETEVSLAVFDLAGRQVWRTAASVRPRGRHVITWDGKAQNGKTVAAGLYFVRLNVGSDVITRRLLVTD